MKPKRLFDEHLIAVVLVCLLSSIILLGSSNAPPLVPISSIATIETGTVVRIVGILVDLWIYDSHAESMMIGDLDDGAVTKVISAPGINPQPSAYARVGDQLCVKGEVGISGAAPVLFASSDDIRLEKESEVVLTVEAVSRNWFLFEGDLVRIKGILNRTGLGVGVRLYDCSGGCSIAVLPNGLDIEPLVGSTATLTATVRFDYGLGMVTLVPSYAAAGQ